METLEISAFDRQASTFAVLPDGRVALDNSSEDMRGIHNILALLGESDNVSKARIASLQEDFQSGNSGAMVFDRHGKSYYLVYESAGFQDWMV